MKMGMKVAVCAMENAKQIKGGGLLTRGARAERGLSVPNPLVIPGQILTGLLLEVRSLYLSCSIGGIDTMHVRSGHHQERVERGRAGVRGKVQSSSSHAQSAPAAKMHSPSRPARFHDDAHQRACCGMDEDAPPCSSVSLGKHPHSHLL